MSLLVPALVLAAAVVATYLCCVRPMRRGHCPMMPGMQSGQAGQASRADPLDAQLAQAGQELGLLRERAELSRQAQS